MTTAVIRSAMAGLMPQLVRFAVAGLTVTAFSALIYLVLSSALAVPALLANVAAHSCGVMLGFQLHSRWSFRQDTRRDGPARLTRFAAASVASLSLNSLWVWALVHGLGAPPWAPVPAMLFVTPLASFAINRWWVFAKR